MGNQVRKRFALVLLLLPFATFPAEKGNVSKGKELFTRCSICHGSSGEGNEAIAKAYGVKMRALGSREVQAMDDAALKKIILEGKGKMPPVKMSDAEAANIIAFVRTLKKPLPKQ